MPSNPAGTDWQDLTRKLLPSGDGTGTYKMLLTRCWLQRRLDFDNGFSQPRFANAAALLSKEGGRRAKRERGGERPFSMPLTSQSNPQGGHRWKRRHGRTTPRHMSKLLESQVWQSALKAELKPLAAVVADMGNDDGLGIYPSVEYLAWILGRSERAIQTSLKELGHLGILQRLTNHQGGRHQIPQYRFHGKNLPERPAWQETRKGADFSPFGKGAVNDTKRVKSTTGKGEKSAPDPLVEPLDGSVRIDPPYRGSDFLAALRDFESSRTKMRKPLTAEARRLLFKKLAGWDEAMATQALEDAVINRWQGVFEPKNNRNGQSNRPSDSNSTFEFTPESRIS